MPNFEMLDTFEEANAKFQSKHGKTQRLIQKLRGKRIQRIFCWHLDLQFHLNGKWY